MIEIPQPQIGVHLPELLPTGKHVFTLEPPHYLHNLLDRALLVEPHHPTLLLPAFA